MSMNSRPWMAVCLGLAASFGCIASGSSVDLKPMEVDIASASSLGLVANLAMQAMSQTSVTTPCTQVTQACATFPCSTGAVTITLGDACPFPLGGVAVGTISVSGSWTSAKSATLNATFNQVTVASAQSVVASATSIDASPGSLTYVGQNVAVHGVLAVAAQSSWTVESSGDGGTLTLTGADQNAAGANGGQVSVTGAVLSPSCTKNPVAGTAVIQSVSGLNIENSTVSFHSACDGMVDVDGTAVAFRYDNF